jgi:hypothetical protein
MAAKVDSKIAEMKENRVLGVRLFHLFSDRLTNERDKNSRIMLSIKRFLALSYNKAYTCC